MINLLNDLSPLCFAPMEGITDPIYRKTVHQLYPQWSHYFCDFLRIPSVGRYPKKHILKHIGQDIFLDQEQKSKTGYQILASKNSLLKDFLSDFNQMEFRWLDLNLGCPSKTVCGSGGGSSLLQDLKLLKPIVRTIRDEYPGFFSCKIRTGFSNDNELDSIIKLLNDEGVELITVHGRTRQDMYKTKARWDQIEKAVKLSKVPIIGNGDIWEAQDINLMKEQTGCFGVMVARGAMKYPWMAELYESKQFYDSPRERKKKIKTFLTQYNKNCEGQFAKPETLVKAVSRYLFDDLPGGEELKSTFLRSKNLTQINQLIDSLAN